MKIYKKKIYKKNHILEIFSRSILFYDAGYKSTFFLFPQAFDIQWDSIIYENIDFKKYITWYNILLYKENIKYFVKSLFEFYRSINKIDVLKLDQKYILHGDLHLGNIFIPLQWNKILFLDPETPNSYDFELFTWNTIAFEISYMLYHLDNHWPIWDPRFYKNNFYFKKVLWQEIPKYVFNKSSNGTLLEIQREYFLHILRKFEFSLNPLLLVHRIFRFLVIFLKYILWKLFLKH